MSNTVQDWDPMDPAHAGYPIEIHAQLREKCPVAWSERFGGFYAVMRYEDVKKAALDSDTFSNDKAVIPDSAGPDRPPRAPSEVDPPIHGHFRDLLNRFFTPDRMRLLEPVIRRTARELLGRCLSLGETDAVAGFTFHLPIRVQCIFLGISEEDGEQIKNTVNRIIEAGAVGDTVEHKRGNDEIYKYIEGIIEARRNSPHDPNDVISALINEEVGGKRLTLSDISGVIRLFLQAGHGTTTNALGSTILHLGTHPKDQKRLRENPKLIPQALEEILRAWSPVRMVGRKATRDVEIAGRVIPKGSRVALMVASANRDATAFNDADTVDFDRKPNLHIAMGYGIHRCVGAALARAELKVATEELLKMTDDFVVTGCPEFSTWSHLGPKKLPVRFTPRTTEETPDVKITGPKDLVMTVSKVTSIATDVLELTLKAPEGTTLSSWSPGSHIDLVLPGDMKRSYSLVGRPDETSSWKIAVLREHEGRGGSETIHKLQVGDKVRVKPPRNNFKLKPAQQYHFFASGIGITPILGMLIAAKAQGVPVRLDYVGRSRDKLAYLDQVSTLEEVHCHFTSEGGRPDLHKLIAESPAEAAIYACGSEAFLLSLEQAAFESGRTFHTEWFAPKPGARQAAEGSLEAFTVKLERSDLEVNVLPGQTIIDACAEVGVEIPASCFEGTCGSCLSTVLEGTPDHRDSFLSANERKSNCLMAACVSKSMTKRLVLDW